MSINIVEMAAEEVSKLGAAPVKMHAFSKAIIDAFPIILRASESDDPLIVELANDWLADYATLPEKKAEVVGNVS